MEDSTEIKRKQLQKYIQQEVLNEKAVKGIVVIGSVATGKAGLGSDIDAVVFLDPIDLYAVPAEFQWSQFDGSYHGIFVDVDQAIQLDFKRVGWQEWSSEMFDWPEPIKLELSAGWIAYDPNGQIKKLIKDKTELSDTTRCKRLDDAITWLDQLLGGSTTDEVWSRYDKATAHDRLNDAYQHLIGGIFAYNRVWRPWRSREQSYLGALDWLPETLKQNVAEVVVPANNSKSGYDERAGLLKASFEELVSKCQIEGLYRENPIDEAFLRTHEEPGRDWNIEEWVVQHKLKSRESS